MSEKASGLVPFEAQIGESSLVVKVGDAEVTLLDPASPEKQLHIRPAEVAVGRSVYLDKPVIPQNHRLRWPSEP